MYGYEYDPATSAIQKIIILHSFFTDNECYQEGSVYGIEYDPATSACTCKPGWHGNKCQKGKPDDYPIVAKVYSEIESINY